MTRQKPLFDQLIGELTPGFGARGYKWVKSRWDFEKKVPTGRYSCHLQFINYRTYFAVTVHVFVQDAKLAKLVKDINGKLDNPEAISIAGVGAELGNISRGKHLKWRIRSQADIPAVCEDILEAFDAIGAPYLERFSSLEEILAVTSNDRSGSLHSPGHAYRAKTAIAAAFALGKRELFVHLVDQKTKFLEERDEFGIWQFLDFADALNECWPGELGSVI